jgi:hypothetical protein
VGYLEIDGDGYLHNTLVLRPQTATNGSSIVFYEKTAGAYNWQISHNVIAGSALEITPSTAAGNTTFSTPALTFNGATSSAVFRGVIFPQQAATGSAPSYVKGGLYFDTTLNKLRVGGATGWETITSI